MGCPRRLLAGASSVLSLTLVACGRHLTVAGPTPKAPFVWTPHDQICVVEPQDARFGDTVYAGSGAAVADRIARVLLQHSQVKAIRVTDQSRPMEACAARRGTYAVVPTILEWHHARNVFFMTDSLKLELSLQRRGSEDALRTVDFGMEDSRPNVLVSPHDVLPNEFDDAVLLLLSTP